MWSLLLTAMAKTSWVHLMYSAWLESISQIIFSCSIPANKTEGACIRNIGCFKYLLMQVTTDEQQLLSNPGKGNPLHQPVSEKLIDANLIETKLVTQLSS